MFISDYIRDGVLKLHQVPTYQQVADIGTKALPWAAFSVLSTPSLVWRELPIDFAVQHLH